jgi:hypothetical protein
MVSNEQQLEPIPLSSWIALVGVTDTTAWRWRQKGWINTINIAGRQYVTFKARQDFTRRAEAGEFAKVHKVPSKKALPPQT